jgi:HK97 family phage portal protein
MSSFAKRFRAGFEGKSFVSEPTSVFQGPQQYATSLTPNSVSPYQAWLLYKNVSSFAKVVDLISDSVASLVPVVKVNGKIVDGHPAALFLKRPGFRRTRRRLIKEAAVQYLVTGTAYLHAYGEPNQPPIALDIIKSHFMTCTHGTDMWPHMHTYSEGSRSIRFVKDQNPRDPRFLDMDGQWSELIPVFDMDGDMRGVGMPRLNAIRTDVELRLKGIQHNSSVLDKGARLSGVLAFKDSMNAEQEEAVRHMFSQRATGADNAGGVLVTSGGAMDFTALSQSMKDMDFAKLIEIVEDSIASRYNVPVALFRTNAQTDNNYETAWNVLYDQAILPTFDILFAGIGLTFSERLGMDIEIVHDALTAPMLAKAAVGRARELFGSNLVSRNEARQIVGYEPVLGGDIIYGSAGMVPQGEDLFTGIDNSHPEPGGKPLVLHPQPVEKEPAKIAGKKSDPVKAAIERLTLVVDNLALKGPA